MYHICVDVMAHWQHVRWGDEDGAPHFCHAAWLSCDVLTLLFPLRPPEGSSSSLEDRSAPSVSSSSSSSAASSPATFPAAAAARAAAPAVRFSGRPVCVADHFWRGLKILLGQTMSSVAASVAAEYTLKVHAGGGGRVHLLGQTMMSSVTASVAAEYTLGTWGQGCMRSVCILGGGAGGERRREGHTREERS